MDLLKSEEFAQYGPRPQLLRERIQNIKTPTLVVIDEIQKIPALLDEVHWLIENTPHTFALSGSSARKLKRTQANMLGGRALRYELYGLVSKELGEDFELVKLLNRGYLPSHYLASEQEIKRLIASYVGDYLQEEIAAEAKVRNLRSFSDFLEKWVSHELRAYNSYCDKFQNISYWRLTTGVEVDFVVGSSEIMLACEAKASSHIHTEHLKGLRELSKEYHQIHKRMVVSLEDLSRTTEDGIEILSVNDFIAALWEGRLF